MINSKRIDQLDPITVPMLLTDEMVIVPTGTIIAKKTTVGEIRALVSPPLTSYANDAAADADTSLLSGGFYLITGGRTVFQKP